MINENKPVILKKNPEIKEDVSILKVIMDPLDLAVLKTFIKKKKPLTVRRISNLLLSIIYGHDLCGEKTEDAPPNMRDLLDAAGYEKHFPSNYLKKKEREQQLSFQQILEQKEGVMSVTQAFNFCKYKLRKHNIKFPSYDKIKAICKRFEKEGILRLKKQGKKFLYHLHPKFYLAIKDNKDQILEL